MSFLRVQHTDIQHSCVHSQILGLRTRCFTSIKHARVIISNCKTGAPTLFGSHSLPSWFLTSSILNILLKLVQPLWVRLPQTPQSRCVTAPENLEPMTKAQYLLRAEDKTLLLTQQFSSPYAQIFVEVYSTVAYSFINNTFACNIISSIFPGFIRIYTIQDPTNSPKKKQFCTSRAKFTLQGKEPRYAGHLPERT